MYSVYMWKMKNKSIYLSISKFVCVYLDDNLRWNEHAHKVTKINQIILHYRDL